MGVAAIRKSRDRLGAGALLRVHLTVKREPREISAIMRLVRSRDTTPELLLRKALRAAGLRFRTYAANLPGKPDIVIESQRLAIFIDGDFWHGGQWRRRRLTSLEEQFRQTESRAYWLRKIRRNMDRDCRATAALIESGWTVFRLWESEVRSDIEQCTTKILNAGSKSVRAFPGKTFAEFFAGIGLMRCALEKHGWTAAYSNDIDPKKLDRSFAGRELDASFFRDLPPSVDPCGENGEFHTFVFDGPIFRHPIPVTAGEVVERDSFIYADLIPNPAVVGARLSASQRAKRESAVGAQQCCAPIAQASDSSGHDFSRSVTSANSKGVDAGLQPGQQAKQAQQ